MVTFRQLAMLPMLLATLVLKQAAASSRALGREGADSVWTGARRGLRHVAADMTFSNATAQLGASAFLRCQQPDDDRPTEVSWLRRRDWHLLTTGKAVFTSDKRFHIFHEAGSADWVLKISFVQLRDRGVYECQVSTSTGKLSHLVHLHVVQPKASIQGAGVYHVERGSTVSLVCAVRQTLTPPAYVVWYHNKVPFDPYRLRSDMQVSLQRRDRETTSVLKITDVRLSDSGSYTCSADTARAASVSVFVSEGDKMAAIQRRKGGSSAGCPGGGTLPVVALSALLYSIAS